MGLPSTGATCAGAGAAGAGACGLLLATGWLDGALAGEDWGSVACSRAARAAGAFVLTPAVRRLGDTFLPETAPQVTSATVNKTIKVTIPNTVRLRFRCFLLISARIARRLCSSDQFCCSGNWRTTVRLPPAYLTGQTTANVRSRFTRRILFYRMPYLETSLH